MCRKEQKSKFGVFISYTLNLKYPAYIACKLRLKTQIKKSILIDSEEIN